MIISKDCQGFDRFCRCEVRMPQKRGLEKENNLWDSPGLVIHFGMQDWQAPM